MKHITQTTTTMSSYMSRRDFLKVAGGFGLSVAGMTLLEACGVKPATPISEDAPLETTTVRLASNPVICLAPLWMAEDLLKSEGFTDVKYVDFSEADFAMQFAGPSLLNIDPASTILAGVDTGCWELFGNEQVNGIADLKGKTISVGGLGAVDHIFISIMLAYVGLDPNKDVTWAIQLDFAEQQIEFTDGKMDAFLVWPPFSQELQIGRAHV